MSVETELQETTSTTPNVAPTVPNTAILKCCICHEDIKHNDSILTCNNERCRKSTCGICLDQMIELMFGQPTLNYPLACGSCGEKFDLAVVDEAIVRTELYEKFMSFVLPLFWSNDCLQESEKLAQCPFCPYVEIHTTDACPLFFLNCRNPSCGKCSCLICLREVEGENDESFHRSICSSLRVEKEMIENAINLGSQQQCPYCSLKGLKDDGCTHMVCERCGLSWCYLCGMKEEECAVDDYEEPTFGAHNRDWESHAGRCPMSLISIHELDDRWPDNDQDCLEHFHRHRTLCKLFEVLNIIGEDRFNELNAAFGTIEASGYTVAEIQDFKNSTLINYSSDDS